MLRCLYDPDEKYLGEMSNYIIRTYGDILRKKLDMFPDFPTWKQIDKIMDVLEGVKFERELLEGVKFEKNSQNRIEQYILNILKKALSKNSYRSLEKMTNNQLDKSRISKTITWLNYGRFDKCEKYAIRMVELILGYKVEKKPHIFLGMKAARR